MFLVYTAIFGKIVDKLRPAPAVSGVRYAAFVEPASKHAANNWQVIATRPPANLGSRRGARALKLQPDIAMHLAEAKDAKYSLWLDGAMAVKPDFAQRLPELLTHVNEDKPLATFRHASRCCVMQEIRECIRLNKDDPAVLNRQGAAYLATGYPHFNGLYETGAVLRYHCEAQQKLDSHWWNQLEQFSVRDQISLPFVSWLTKVPVNVLPGTCYQNPFFDFYSHW